MGGLESHLQVWFIVVKEEMSGNLIYTFVYANPYGHMKYVL